MVGNMGLFVCRQQYNGDMNPSSHSIAHRMGVIFPPSNADYPAHLELWEKHPPPRSSEMSDYSDGWSNSSR